MSNKQTFGPEKETHIDIKKARLARTKAALGGFVVGATTIGAAFGIGGLNHSDRSASSEHLQSDHATHIAVKSTSQFEEITVRKNDTEWNMAERVNGKANPQVTIAELEKVNPDLSASSLQPGEVFKVPINISDHDFSK